MKASLKGHIEIVNLLLAHPDIRVEVEDKVNGWSYLLFFLNCTTIICSTVIEKLYCLLVSNRMERQLRRRLVRTVTLRLNKC